MPDAKAEEEYDSDDADQGDCPEDIITIGYVGEHEPSQVYNLDKFTLKGRLE